MSDRIGRFLFAALLLTCAVFAHGQGLRWDLGSPGSAGVVTTAGTGGLQTLVAQPGVQLAWCNYPANAVPCTNYAPTYNSITLAVACPPNAPIVMQNSNTCQGVSDNFGNMGAWVAPNGVCGGLSCYSYTLTINGASFGPYFWESGAIGGTVNGTPNQIVIANSTASLANTVIFPGSAQMGAPPYVLIPPTQTGEYTGALFANAFGNPMQISYLQNVGLVANPGNENTWIMTADIGVATALANGDDCCTVKNTLLSLPPVPPVGTISKSTVTADGNAGHGNSALQDLNGTIVSSEPHTAQYYSSASLCNGGTAGCNVYTFGGLPGAQMGAAIPYGDIALRDLALVADGGGKKLIVSSRPSPIHQTGKTANITTATLCDAVQGACDQPGQYHVHFDFLNTGTACTNVTAGSVGFQLTWTDTNGTQHAAVQVPMITQASATALAGTMVFVVNNLSAWGSGDITISTNGSIIQYAANYTACTTGTGTYQLDASVTRLQ